jgi:anti-sigma B factor antagonist
MKLEEQLHGAVTVVRPEGPLIGADADQFKQRCLELVQDSLGRCVIDASSVSYVDSRGLEVLVDINDRMFQTGQALRLCGANDTVRQAMELTGLSPAFEYFVDVPDAVRSFL